MRKLSVMALMVSLALLLLIIPSVKAANMNPQTWPFTYKFRLSPFIDQIYISADPQPGGILLHGYDNVTSPSVCYPAPVLGWAAGGKFYMAIDFKTNPSCYELGFVVGSVSTASGKLYRTMDGTTWVGPTAVTLVPF